jgi:ABC-type sugar transport system substrate-binding protein
VISRDDKENDAMTVCNRRITWMVVSLLVLTLAVSLTVATAARAQGKWWDFKINPTDRLAGLPEARPKKPFKFGVAQVSLADYYYVAIIYGVDDEAKRQGVTFDRLLVAGGYEHLATQVKQVEDLIASDVDVIVLFAISEEGTAAVVDKAVAAGKKVINLATGAKNEKVYASLLEDFEGAGARQAEYHCQQYGNRGGKVAMLNGPAGAQWAREMHDGFVKTVKARCPKLEIVDEKWTPLNPGEALKIAEDSFQRYPDLSGIYTVYDTLARPVVPLIKSARKPPSFVITTQGLSPWTRDALLSGDVNMTAAALPITLGRWGVQAAIRAMNGDPGPGLSPPLRAPTPTVTKETIKTADTSGSFYPKDYNVKK